MGTPASPLEPLLEPCHGLAWKRVWEGGSLWAAGGVGLDQSLGGCSGCGLSPMGLLLWGIGSIMESQLRLRMKESWLDTG